MARIETLQQKRGRGHHQTFEDWDPGEQRRLADYETEVIAKRRKTLRVEPLPVFRGTRASTGSGTRPRRILKPLTCWHLYRSRRYMSLIHHVQHCCRACQG